MDKPWKGRFSQPTDEFVEKFTASVKFDRRLYHYDIAGSEAHTQMLAHVGLLTQNECEEILVGLDTIKTEIEQEKFIWRESLEDVHMNIEARLVELIGEAGKKLHTGRSRNDQVVTDLRLFLRDQIEIILQRLHFLMTEIVGRAEAETKTILPGFTHLQAAQPITLGHHMLAWFEMFKRDYQRLTECNVRVDVMPLGAAALAGTSYPIDRKFTAQKLAFAAIAENSLDAVSDRDFAIEFVSDCSIIMNHLSRISEELVLWSTPQFDFIDLGEGFCTGSSIMPQKKNPDVPELVRGKTARVTGHLVALLMLMKAQPLAYNKDNQEDKEPIFDTVDTVQNCLRVYSDMIAKMEINRQQMLKVAHRGYTTATDLADYLVNKGIAFRDAHEIVGQTVRFAIEQNKELTELTLKELQKFSDVIHQDVFAVLSLEGSVNARRHLGGTAPEQVMAATKRAKKWLQKVGQANK